VALFTAALQQQKQQQQQPAHVGRTGSAQLMREEKSARDRWKAWKEKKGYLTPPNAANAAAEDSTSETVDSTAVPAAERAASAAKKVAATAAVTQQAWVWEPRD
jgi:hypothetical protein